VLSSAVARYSKGLSFLVTQRVDRAMIIKSALSCYRLPVTGDPLLAASRGFYYAAHFHFRFDATLRSFWVSQKEADAL
jgi:hypothetical protein